MNTSKYIVMILILIFSSVNSYYTSDYDENTPRQFIEKLNELDANEDEPEPINPFNRFTTSRKNDGKNDTAPRIPLESKNILCDDFEEYASNCTFQAKKNYNSTITLPLPNELRNWCKALKQLASCEYDWNTDCQDVTEKKFNDFIIQGQLHVIDKVCHDDWFSANYDMPLYKCIMAVSKDWTTCFLNMKFHTDQHKNATNNWAHYETHFYLCCEKTRFRRCTLEVLLNFPDKCTSQQSILLQKFSTIISEGEVFQDCNFNMMYPSCPGGDPRPPTALVSKLMKDELRSIQELKDSAFRSATIGSLQLITLCYYYIFK
ncbi:uncharacterized protein LOC133516378 [Cydia pomonella]|uniref:uncharacterized protein LOC133516378 n=1 Tax=Cydia pomonella TaxID=82600 RepID=UPI002ADE76ED|nr:uncharacterized protein LOC133516378 [Cydia pomonella]